MQLYRFFFLMATSATSTKHERLGLGHENSPDVTKKKVEALRTLTNLLIGDLFVCLYICKLRAYSDVYMKGGSQERRSVVGRFFERGATGEY